MLTLKGIHIVSLALNVPGPVAAARLQEMGGSITKIEPQSGDPLMLYSSEWYEQLARGQQVLKLDLKETVQRGQFDELLKYSDLLITSMRLPALERLALDWSRLHRRFPNLSQIALIGYSSENKNLAGHDLNYQSALGLISPPQLPKTLFADIAAAERIVSTALLLLLAREKRLKASGYAEVSIYETAKIFAAPLHYDLTSRGGTLGGGDAAYNLYRTADGWIALAALEPHFWNRLLAELNLQNANRKELKNIFLTDTSENWTEWAKKRDIPITAVV
ncbi:MAG TPA: CoA transferase [Pyrinomonadaceae bacterium]|jgi:crotonobetainyl-CoA:carnitine CoA-transferase CaiB-like acyl-CoA transferase